MFIFFFQAEDGIRDKLVTGVQTCALPIYLLRQNVQWRFGNGDAVEIPLTNGAHQGSAFQQVVAGGRENAAFGHCSTPVTRAANTLQAHRNRSEEHTSELQSLAYLVCRLLLE